MESKMKIEASVCKNHLRAISHGQHLTSADSSMRRGACALATLTSPSLLEHLLCECRKVLSSENRTRKQRKTSTEDEVYQALWLCPSGQRPSQGAEKRLHQILPEGSYDLSPLGAVHSARDAAASVRQFVFALA